MIKKNPDGVIYCLTKHEIISPFQGFCLFIPLFVAINLSPFQSLLANIDIMFLLFKEFCRAFGAFELPKDFVLILVAKIGSFFVFLA